MKKLTFSLIIIAGLFYAGNTTDRKINFNNSEQNIIESLKKQKAAIDTLFNRNSDKLLILVKLEDNQKLQRVLNLKFPKNVEITYNILKDDFGKILTVYESPFSKSGDWFIIYKHYFDNNGKTFAFERQTNFFNSICTQGVAYETKTEFYDEDFKLLQNEYKLVNEKNEPLKKDSCQFPYNFDYKASINISDYLRLNNIKDNQ